MIDEFAAFTLAVRYTHLNLSPVDETPLGVTPLAATRTCDSPDVCEIMPAPRQRRPPFRLCPDSVPRYATMTIYADKATDRDNLCNRRSRTAHTTRLSRASITVAPGLDLHAETPEKSTILLDERGTLSGRHAKGTHADAHELGIVEKPTSLALA